MQHTSGQASKSNTYHLSLSQSNPTSFISSASITSLMRLSSPHPYLPMLHPKSHNITPNISKYLSAHFNESTHGFREEIDNGCGATTRSSTHRELQIAHNLPVALLRIFISLFPLPPCLPPTTCAAKLLQSTERNAFIYVKTKYYPPLLLKSQAIRRSHE